MATDEHDLTTARQAAQIEAGEQGELLALARSAAHAGTWDLDIRKGVVRYCPRSLEILGHPPDRSPVLTAAASPLPASPPLASWSCRTTWAVRFEFSAFASFSLSMDCLVSPQLRTFRARFAPPI